MQSQTASDGSTGYVAASLLVAAALLLGACSQTTAEISDEAPVIAESTSGTATAAGTEVTPTPAAPTADPAPTAETISPESPTPTAAVPAPSSVAASNGSVVDHTDLLQQFGCDQATALRLTLSSSGSDSVEAAAKLMPRNLWLCPISNEIAAALECFGDETNTLIAAMRTDLGDEGVAAANELVRQRAVFCADPNVTRLGIDDVVEGLIEAEAEQSE